MSSTSPTYVAVVDDDESLCRSLARLLRAAGIQPVTYGSAEAFLADSKRPQFDCMVFDVQLGGMSGIELAQGIAALAPGADHLHHRVRRSGNACQRRATGCAAYFRKNESGADVLEAIRRLTA